MSWFDLDCNKITLLDNKYNKGIPSYVKKYILYLMGSNVIFQTWLKNSYSAIFLFGHLALLLRILRAVHIDIAVGIVAGRANLPPALAVT